MEEKTVHPLDGGRIDLAVYNEANAIFFCCQSELEEEEDYSELFGDRPQWTEAVASGRFLPLELYQDDCFNVRFVLGELTETEKSEWVGRVTTKLNIPSGALALSAGFEALYGEVDEENIHLVEVPEGAYRVTVYAYLPGVNGDWHLEEAGFEGDLEEWFNESRPGMEISQWLEARLNEEEDEEEGIEYVHFLVHLEPISDEDEVPFTLTEEGALQPETRIPDACPLGIETENLVETSEEGE
ncbi:MAG: hypothetical protein KC964_24490 [Candidatus Omnitrophica bacterium]|nr:hypothetical protein [Candidatus Omnitrophota bacterium]